MNRTYDIHWVPVIICSQCEENIVERADERRLETRAQVRKYQLEHENQHRQDEGRKPLPVPGS